MRSGIALLIAFALLIKPGKGITQLNFQNDSLTALLKKSMPDVNENTAGYVIGISHKNETIYSQAFGSANIEAKIPLSTASIFNIGSVTKQFVGWAILELEDEGMLNIDDSASKYLPEYPVLRNNGITVYHLLHHTSGLREMFELLEASDNQVYGLTMDQVKYILLKQRTVNFKPGRFYDYSNTNYFFLTLIIEKLRACSFPDYAREKIFVPLDMNTAIVPKLDQTLIPNRTQAYIKQNPSTFTRANPSDNFYGPGGIYCSMPDLLKWGGNFMSKKIGSQALHQKFITKGKYRNDQPINYAQGLFIDQYNGIDIIEHSGSRLGYTAQLVYIPGKDIVIVILANSRSFPVRDIYRKVMDYLLKGQFPEPKAVPAPKPVLPPAITLKPEELAKFAGIYWSEASDLRRQVYLKNGGLFYRRTPTNESEMIPIDHSGFLVKINNAVTNNRIEFSKEKSSAKWKLTFMPERGDTSLFQQMDTIVSGTDKSSYTGQFYCDEIDTKFEILNQADQLVLIIKGWEPILLEPGFKDYFYNTDFGGSIYFKRNKKGRISSFTYTSPRTRNMVFHRMMLDYSD